MFVNTLNENNIDLLVHRRFERSYLRLLAVWWPGDKVHETTTFLLVTLPNIHRFNKKIHQLT